MPENDIRQDFSPNGAIPAPTIPFSQSRVAVPRYVLYGDAGPRPDWFVHIEPVDRRCRERGWEIKPHIHPRFAQVMIVSEGGGTLTLEGSECAFRPGSVVVMPPHAIHGFRYDRDSMGWVITIENHYLADLLERAPALQALMTRPGVFDCDPSILGDVAQSAERLAGELEGCLSGSAIGAEIHLMSILLLLFRHWPRGDVAAAPAPGHNRVRLVERYKAVVEARFRQQPALADVARELGVSVSQLRLACTSVAGMAPLAILHERILSEARRCLAYTGMSITEIADELGFSEGSYFTRFFTRNTGETPSEWRRAQGQRIGLVA